MQITYLIKFHSLQIKRFYSANSSTVYPIRKIYFPLLQLCTLCILRRILETVTSPELQVPNKHTKPVVASMCKSSLLPSLPRDYMCRELSNWRLSS